MPYTGLVCGGCLQTVAVILNSDSDDSILVLGPNCGHTVTTQQPRVKLRVPCKGRSNLIPTNYSSRLACPAHFRSRILHRSATMNGLTPADEVRPETVLTIAHAEGETFRPARDVPSRLTEQCGEP